MLPFAVMPGPVSFPYACVGCGGQKGPVVNTHRDLPGYGSVVLCTSCTRQAAQVLGFAPGEKLEELEHAVEKQAADEREMELQRARIAELEELYALTERKLAETEDMLGEANGRVLQLEGRIAEEARAALELVGDAS